jgi:hypothetical protein
MFCKEWHLLVNGLKKTDIEYIFGSIHPFTTKIKVPFLTQLLERKETAQGFHHEANGDFKMVTED